MYRWHLARMNVATALYPHDDPALQGFVARPARLERDGPSADAFTFTSKFPPPDITGDPDDLAPEPDCAGWR
jgi:hypothetical protein